MKLKKVYDEAKQLYAERNIKADIEQHLSRLFQYAINLKRMDFISKNCLNPIFRDVLISNGYIKSQDFMQEVKRAYAEEKINFQFGRIVFENPLIDCYYDELKGKVKGETKWKH